MSIAGERGLIAAQIAALERAGVPLAQAVSACRDAAVGAKLRAALAAAADRLAAGDAPSAAFAAGPLFSADACAVVEAAEPSGAVQQALTRVAELSAVRHRLASAARRMLAYPLGLAIAAGLLAVLTGRALVELWSFYPEMREGPLDAAAQLAVGTMPGLLSAGGWLVAAVGVAGLALLARRGFTLAPLSLPLSGSAVRRALVADLVASVGAARRHGVATARALELAGAAVVSRRSRTAVSRAAEAASGGVDLAAAMQRAGIAGARESRLIAAAEESDDPDALEELARDLTSELERDVDRTLRLAGPLAVISIGAIIYLIIYAGLRPAWSMGPFGGH